LSKGLPKDAQSAYFPMRLPLFGDQLQQGVLGSGELRETLFHEVIFELLGIDLGGDVGQHFWPRQAVNLTGEGQSAGGHGGVGGGRIGLDVAARERLDILPLGVRFFLTAGAGEDNLLRERQALIRPKLLVCAPNLFGVDDADLALSSRGERGNALFGVGIHPRDKDAVDALEQVAASPLLGAAPNGVAGGFVLSHGEDEGDVERDAGGAERLQAFQAGGRGGHFDHPVFVAGGPLFAQFDIAADALGVRHVGGHIFDERIELKAHIAVVALGFFPDGQENILSLLDQLIGEFPGQIAIAKAFGGQFGDVGVKPARFDQVRHNDRVGCGAGCAFRPILTDKIRID
jgi:hypothetical protein